MPTAKMTAAVLEAHRGFHQDQHGEDRTVLFKLVARRMKRCALPWKEHGTRAAKIWLHVGPERC